MKKFFALALSLALALTAFAGCSSTSASTSTPSAASGSTAGSAGTAASGELNLYTWEGMFPQEVLDAFTAETGIKVNYSSFDTDETMLAKLETAKGGDYDVVIADDYIIETAIADLAKDALCQDRPGRIAGAQEQDVKRLRKAHAQSPRYKE